MTSDFFKGLGLKELPVYNLKFTLPVNIYEPANEACKQCGKQLVKIITHLEPSRDDQGHYLGFYQLGFYVECLDCKTWKNSFPVIPSSYLLKPKRRKRKVIAPGMSKL